MSVAIREQLAHHPALPWGLCAWAATAVGGSLVHVEMFWIWAIVFLMLAAVAFTVFIIEVRPLEWNAISRVGTSLSYAGAIGVILSAAYAGALYGSVLHAWERNAGVTNALAAVPVPSAAPGFVTLMVASGVFALGIWMRAGWEALKAFLIGVAFTALFFAIVLLQRLMPLHA
ncbi:MAG: hypothetical protein MUC42_15170 [Bryobacter sp.]|jgi:hypothetical protein|nr:hypothetical protein [Bryobacter sp.]